MSDLISTFSTHTTPVRFVPANAAECATRYRWKTECPNMKEREGDLSMICEHYDCKVCGAHVALDYDEMR